uniref:Uncharacterized protein n=1 Tax=Anopheles farauti TaxID=69004 RepID=A0A182QA67_9DIPT
MRSTGAPHWYWSLFVLLISASTICFVPVQSKKFQFSTDRPDYKQLVGRASKLLERQVVEFASVVRRLELLLVLANMSCKQIAVLTAYALLLLIATVSATAPVEPAVEQQIDAKSYFGYHPHQKDSYKKLAIEVNDFGTLFKSELESLVDKIKTLHQKVFYRKDKDNYGGGYDVLQMQKLYNKQKAALEALRNERPGV